MRRTAALHRVIRHETSRLPASVAAIVPGDEAGARLVGTWAFDVLDATHHYFAIHAAVLSRLIRTRAADDRYALAVMSDAAQDRQAVESLLGECLAAVVHWQDGASARDRADLSAGLVRLGPAVDAALRRIESEVGPVADRYVDDRFTDVVADYPFRALGGRRGRALLGAVLEADAPEGIAAPGARGSEPGPVATLRRARARREYRRRTSGITDVAPPTDIP